MKKRRLAFLSAFLVFAMILLGSIVQAQSKKELEKISKLSAEEAKGQLIKLIEKQSEEDFLVLMNKLETHGEEMLQKKAQDILAISIQRLSSSYKRWPNS